MTESLTDRDDRTALSMLLYVAGNILTNALNRGRWVMGEDERSELMEYKHFIERLSDKYRPWVEEESRPEPEPEESSNPPEWERTATAVEEVSTMQELVYGDDEQKVE